jgi:hypothetical protein
MLKELCKGVPYEKAYYANPFEIEAYERQEEYLTEDVQRDLGLYYLPYRELKDEPNLNGDLFS